MATKACIVDKLHVCGVNMEAVVGDELLLHSLGLSPSLPLETTLPAFRLSMDYFLATLQLSCDGVDNPAQGNCLHVVAALSPCNIEFGPNKCRIGEEWGGPGTGCGRFRRGRRSRLWGRR